MSDILTLEAVKDWVEAIRLCAGDDEAAHGAEDALHHAVLHYVAHHSPDSLAAAMARTALTSAEISFARWCA